MRFGYVANGKDIGGQGGGVCNCFHGTPVIDANGGCSCNDGGIITKPVGMGYYGSNPIAMATSGRPIVDPYADIRKPLTRRCGGKIAPAGYAYQVDGATGLCNMVVDYNYNPSTIDMRNSTGVTTTGITATAQNFLTNNKGLIEVAAVIGIGYLLLKHSGGGKGRTRERDVITKSY